MFTRLQLTERERERKNKKGIASEWGYKKKKRCLVEGKEKLNTKCLPSEGVIVCLWIN